MRRWFSRSISKILMVLSEEQVWVGGVSLGGERKRGGGSVYRETLAVVVQLAVVLRGGGSAAVLVVEMVAVGAHDHVLMEVG